MKQFGSSTRNILIAAFAGFLALTGVQSVEAEQVTDDRKVIRPYANGAGPVAIFRYGRQEDKKRDVFGVVDPTLWRIQFFTLDDWSVKNARPFADRFTKVGDCALPPTFRVWRIHQFSDRIVFQSQPEVPVKALIHNGRPAPLVFKKLVLPATPADLQAVLDAKPTDINAVPSARCGGIGPSEFPNFDAGDTSVRVTGGEKKPFSARRLDPPTELGAFGKTTITLAAKGRYLVAAQELEFAQDASTSAPLRHFLLTTRTNLPGFASTEVLLVRQSPAQKLNARMSINLGISRVKMGNRSIAVASTGEVLIMGTFDKQNFYVNACHFVASRFEQERCQIEDDEGSPVPVATASAAQGDSEKSLPVQVSKLRALAFKYTDQIYQVDMKDRPSGCTSLAACPILSKIEWSPLAELRLAKGTVIRKGVPYGQSATDAARPKFKPNDKVNSPIAMSIYDTSKVPPVVFGDIENDSAVSEINKIHVFGIDCSAFLSHLWQLGSVLDTGSFIASANSATSTGFDRVIGLSNATLGDALVINISQKVKGKSQRLLNHIVSYQEPRPAGPLDSSRAILVVEASSSCGGACWTFYDESFFHGWAIIRNSKPTAKKTPFEKIPTEVKRWRELFVSQ